MIMSTVAAYRVGHVLFFGLSIALIVVFIYLKVVLLKYVSRSVRAQAQEQQVASQPQRKAKKKKSSK
ncbi:sortase [Sphingobacterium corticibacter]|uniref:Sortase n=2 Tax=Sphingobacterium corticibacter TaxID=2171749 RepID=A0A2T8HKJ7_9SPHI|nr:sortase [Sphingobacterium corticibacter]